MVIVLRLREVVLGVQWFLIFFMGWPFPLGQNIVTVI